MSMVLESSSRDNECLWSWRVVQETVNVYGPGE